MRSQCTQVAETTAITPPPCGTSGSLDPVTVVAVMLFSSAADGRESKLSTALAAEVDSVTGASCRERTNVIARNARAATPSTEGRRNFFDKDNGKVLIE